MATSISGKPSSGVVRQQGQEAIGAIAEELRGRRMLAQASRKLVALAREAEARSSSTLTGRVAPVGSTVVRAQQGKRHRASVKSKAQRTRLRGLVRVPAFFQRRLRKAGSLPSLR